MKAQRTAGHPVGRWFPHGPDGAAALEHLERTYGEQATPEAIAKAIGKPVRDVAPMLSRLERKGIITFTAAGKWKLLDKPQPITLLCYEGKHGRCLGVVATLNHDTRHVGEPITGLLPLCMCECHGGAEHRPRPSNLA